MDSAPTFRLKLANRPDRDTHVELKSLGATAQAWSEILASTAEHLASLQPLPDLEDQEEGRKSSRPLPRFHWVVTGIKLGSLDIAAEPVVEIDDEFSSLPDEFWNSVHQYLSSNLQRLEGGSPPEEVFPSSLVKPVYRLLSSFHKNGIGTLDFGYENHWAAQLSWERAGLHHKSAIRETSIGSIEGRIASISFAQQPQFGLRPYRGNIVPCAFDERALLEDVTRALRRRVSVFGRIVRDGNGTPIRMPTVRTIEILPEDEDMPSVADLFGSMPEVTDGLSTADWLRRQRGEI